MKDKILSTSKILGLISEKQPVAQKEYYKYVNIRTKLYEDNGCFYFPGRGKYRPPRTN
ncbi:MAG: hypothetical protein GX767_01130 [Firmicutes bacterium]|nr:hypothetical protein [Bacillota bacterium]